jgi:predicted RecA/RadA family phage recombinase
MKNFIASGATLTITAGADIASGAGVLAGGLFGVAAGDIEEDAQGVINLTGVYELPKVGSQAWTVGARVYWNGSACTTAANAGVLIGVAVEAVTDAAGATLGKVRLPAPAPAKAAFVANASAGSAAEINAVRDALVTAGLMAPS